MWCLSQLQTNTRKHILRTAVSLVMAGLCCVPHSQAQDVPLISGGIGFFTSTNAGNTTYLPVLSPLLAAPLGRRFLVESRAFLLESYFPKGKANPGYTSSPFLSL